MSHRFNQSFLRLETTSFRLSTFALRRRSAQARDTTGGARQTVFGLGLGRGVAIVLAVAALACWFGRTGASPVAPSTAAPAIAARVAVGAALAEQSPNARPVRSESVTGPSGAAYYARAIETIQTGQRVLARNPELAGVELPDAAFGAGCRERRSRRVRPRCAETRAGCSTSGFQPVGDCGVEASASV